MGQKTVYVCDRCQVHGPNPLKSVRVGLGVARLLGLWDPSDIELCEECTKDFVLWLTCYEKVPSEG